MTRYQEYAKISKELEDPFHLRTACYDDLSIKKDDQTLSKTQVQPSRLYRSQLLNVEHYRSFLELFLPKTVSLHLYLSKLQFKIGSGSLLQTLISSYYQEIAAR